jgi:hypothetical protein
MPDLRNKPKLAPRCFVWVDLGTMNLVAGSDEQHDHESLYLEDSFRYQLPPWLILTSFES